jgi:hypothetical protein
VTSVERVPLERITRRAHAARPGRTALAVVASVLFGLGWLIARTLGLLWIGLAYAAAALAEGWVAGRSAEWSQHVARRQEEQRAGRRRQG